MKLLVQLGKLGDIINLLPLAWHYQKEGNRIGIMVAKEYADILDGCSYVDKVVFDGPAHELRKAVQEAKKLSDDVVVTQVLGPMKECEELTYSQVKPPHATTESFQKEAWRMAGALKLWETKLPLFFDNREPENESGFVPPKSRRKVMLVSSGGVSSPFRYKKLLMELLWGRFGKWQIIDLSTIKADRFYNLLGLYERANLLISTDSAPLHLAYAVPTLPVCALIGDSPALWNGSVWRTNHIFHCRYNDFPMRAVEMLERIEQVTARKWVSKRSEKLIAHVYSHYDRRSMEHSQPNWETQYATGRWTECPIEVGSVGKDSGNVLKDNERFPFLRDVLRNASLTIDDESDIFCLTRQDTCFHAYLTERILSSNLCYAHRVTDGKYHPGIDLFCFPKSWWTKNRADLPNLIMGRDVHWQKVLLAALKRDGAVELPLGSVFSHV